MTTQKQSWEAQQSQMQQRVKKAIGSPAREDQEEELSRSALALFRAKEEEIERKKMEMREKVENRLGRAEEATKRLAEIREELEGMTDPMRKEVSLIRKKIDLVNKELKPLGITCQKKEREYKEVLELLNEKNKEKSELIAKLMELVNESEKLRMNKLEELSNNIDPRFILSASPSMALSSLPLFLSLRSFYSARPILPPLLPKPRAFSSTLLRSHPHHFGAPLKASTEGAAMAQKIFDTEEALMVSLAKYTADLSHKFSVKRGSFSLVLSGGSLVKSLRKLVEPPYMDSVEWSKWHVFWLDEKTIPKDQDGCNYKLAYDYFLSQVPLLPGNVYAINEALSAEGATDDYETCLRHLVKCGVIDMSTATGLPKFDLMLIGMDPDGHIASVFTDHPFLQEDNGKWVTFIHESPKPPIDIITLTLPVINSSAHMAIVSTSGHQAMSTSNSVKNSGDLDGKMPIQWVSPEGELTWFLTGDAAETVGEKCV